MKYVKYCILFTICMFIMPNITHAACDYQRLAELSRIAGNVQFSYNYEFTDATNPNFSVDITNITNDIYIVDDYNRAFYKDTSQVYGGNRKIKFIIYSNDNNCKNEEILTKYVNIPSYNSYSGHQDCIDYPDFKYCDMWMDTSEISLETFNNEMQKYIKSQNNNIDSDVNKKSFLDSFLDIILQNKTTLIIVLIVAIFLSLLIVAKRRWIK